MLLIYLVEVIQINGSYIDNSISIVNDIFNSYYSSDEHENSLIYSYLDLDDIEQDKNLDRDALKRVENLNLRIVPYKLYIYIYFFFFYLFIFFIEIY